MSQTTLSVFGGSGLFGLDRRLQLQGSIRRGSMRRPQWSTSYLADTSQACRASVDDKDSVPLMVEDIQTTNEEILPRAEPSRQRQAEINGLTFSTIAQKPWEAMDRESMLNLMGLAFVFSLAFFEFVTIDVGVSRGWTASEFAMRTAMDNWGNYEMFLHQNPILVKAYTSGIVYAISDWLTQVIESGKPLKFDRGSILRNASIGFLAHGPLTHFWYLLSDALVPYNASWYGWIPKMALNQTIWAFAWNVIYIMMIETMQGRSAKQALAVVDKMWWPLQVKGWKFWPLVHVITYNFIPIDDRVLWVDVVGVIWMMIVINCIKDDDKKRLDDRA